MTLKSFGTPVYVADRGSMDTFGTGVQIDFSKFTDPKYGTPGKRRIPTGTVIEPIGTGAPDSPLYLCGPAAGTAGKPQLILKTDAEEDSKTAALTGYGAYAGGVVYENLLPDATGTPRVLNATVKAAMTKFTFMTYGDAR